MGIENLTEGGIIKPCRKGKRLNSKMNCTYFNPVLYDGGSPTGTNQVFNFSSSTCETAAVEVFLPDFTYGEIVIGTFSLLLLISFWLYAFWKIARGVKFRL